MHSQAFWGSHEHLTDICTHICADTYMERECNVIRGFMNNTNLYENKWTCVEMRFIAHIVGGNLMQLSMLFVDGDKKGKREIHMKGFLH